MNLLKDRRRDSELEWMMRDERVPSSQKLAVAKQHAQDKIADLAVEQMKLAPYDTSGRFRGYGGRTAEPGAPSGGMAGTIWNPTTDLERSNAQQFFGQQNELRNWMDVAGGGTGNARRRNEYAVQHAGPPIQSQGEVERAGALVQPGEGAFEAAPQQRFAQALTGLRRAFGR